MIWLFFACLTLANVQSSPAGGDAFSGLGVAVSNLGSTFLFGIPNYGGLEPFQSFLIISFM